MSTFISYNNQTILWNTIQKVPLLQQKIQKEYQANWFRQIIEDIYTQNQYRNLNVQELNELNKQTISYMINSLKRSNNENNQTTSIENLDYQDTNTEFSKREKEYEILKNNTKYLVSLREFGGDYKWVQTVEKLNLNEFQKLDEISKYENWWYTKHKDIYQSILTVFLLNR